MVFLFLIFWRTFHCICSNLHSYQQSTRVPFSLRLLVILCLLILAIWQVWDDTSLWFSFVFLWWWMMLSILLCVFWPSVCLLWKNVYPGPLSIFMSDYLGFWYWVVYKFWMLTTYQVYHLQVIFSHPVDCFVDCLLRCAEAFLSWSPIVPFRCCFPCLKRGS